MDVAVINLAQSADRRERMHRQLIETGLGHRFFDAVDARSDRLSGVSRYDERLARRRYGRALTPGEIGCFASHYLLWQQCVASNRPLLIMEDDLAIEPSFRSLVPRLDELIPSLHFARICVDSDRAYRPVAMLGGGGSLLVRYEKGPRGSQAYALSVDGARRLLDGAEVWCQALDMYLDAFWEHGLPSWAIVPFAARHLPEHQAPSTIGEAKHRRKLTLVAKLRREVTQVRQNFWRYLFNVRQRRRDRRLARALAGVTASAR